MRPSRPVRANGSSRPWRSGAGPAGCMLKRERPSSSGRPRRCRSRRRTSSIPTPSSSSYGADTARWFMLSDTPPERDIEWTEAGVAGAWRFTQRLWRLVHDVAQLPDQWCVQIREHRRAARQPCVAPSTRACMPWARISRACASIARSPASMRWPTRLSEAMQQPVYGAGQPRRHARSGQNPCPDVRAHDAASGRILLACPGVPGAGGPGAVAQGRPETARRNNRHHRRAGQRQAPGRSYDPEGPGLIRG